MLFAQTVYATKSCVELMPLCQIFPGLIHKVDLKHVMDAVQRLGASTTGGKDNALYVKSMIHFSASLPTEMMFHACWGAAFVELSKRKAFALIKYAQQHLLQMDSNGRWVAACAAGINVSVPGHGPHTLQQSLERFNSTIKGTMPVGYHLLSLKEMIVNLERVIRVHMKNNRQVSECEKQVIFTPNDPAVPHPGLVSADWVRPGRDEQDVKLVLPPVWRFLEHLPSNFHGSAFAGALQIWDVLRVYTFPATQAGMIVDVDAHEKMLLLFQASTPEAFTEAGKRLNLFKQEKELDMLSVPRLRTLLSELVLCFKLRRPYCGYSILCTCPYFCTHGSCAHHLLCRWFEKDGKVQLADISEFVAKNVTPTIAGAEAALRQRLLPRGLLPDLFHLI